MQRSRTIIGTDENWREFLLCQFSEYNCNSGTGICLVLMRRLEETKPHKSVILL